MIQALKRLVRENFIEFMDFMDIGEYGVWKSLIATFKSKEDVRDVNGE